MDIAIIDFYIISEFLIRHLFTPFYSAYPELKRPLMASAPVTELESTKESSEESSSLLFSFNAVDKPSSSGKVYSIRLAFVSLVC